MRYAIALLSIGLLLLAPAAYAQVAAPSLSPTRAETTAKNPATQQWAQISHLTAGWIDGKVTPKDTGVTYPEGDLSGYFVGLRLVGDAFSAGAETLHIELDNQFGTLKSNYKSDAMQAALALQAGNTLALGIGYESRKDTSETRDSATGDFEDSKSEFTMPVAGGSIRLGNAFYVGLAGGPETADVESHGTSGGTPFGFKVTGAERDVLRAGVGFYNRDNNGGYHLELYREQRKPFKIEEAPGVVLDKDKQTLDTLSLEGQWGRLLLAYEHQSRETTDQNSGSPDESTNEDTDTVTIGWVPDAGWALLLDYSMATVDHDPGTQTEDRELYALSAAYQF